MSRARAMLGLTILLAALSLVLVGLTGGARIPDAWGFRGANALLGLVFAGAGYLVATRRPHNIVGWLMLGLGLANAVDGASTEYASAVLFGGLAGPAGSVGAWVHDWIWVPYITAFIGLFLYFPDGRLPSRRWAALLWPSVVAGAVVTALFALIPGPLSTFGVQNPLGVAMLAGFGGPTKSEGAVGVMLGVLSLALLASASSLVVRYRRALGDERHQIKWFAAAAVFAGVVFAGEFPFPDTKLSQVAVLASFLTVPVAIGVAILRYRLYEIDTIINAALVYAGLTALLAGVFAATQEILKRVFLSATGQGSDVGVVVALFLIATLFAPARSRLQRAVDTRFRIVPPHQSSGSEVTTPVAIALRDLARLHEDGIVNDAEFETKKTELLARL